MLPSGFGFEKLISVFAILICCTVSAMGQTSLQVSGYVLLENKSPLPGATIIIRQKDSSRIIAYSITDNRGFFAVGKKMGFPGPVLIEVRHIGYASSSRVINISYGMKEYTDSLKFILAPSARILEEVVIRPHPPKLIVRNDTLEYRADAYRTNETRKLDDLLRTMEGFSVNPDGRILHNGKEVQRILIEGEDLSGDSYQLLSKNLSAGVIEKVQVIQHYEENRLLKQVGQSDKVGINLQVYQSKARHLSGGFEAGISAEQKHLLDQNSLLLTKKYKAMGFINSNTIAILPAADIGYHYHGKADVSGGVNQNENNDAIIKSGTILSPMPQPTYSLNNKGWSAGSVLAFKAGPHTKIRTMVSATGLSLRNKADGRLLTIISSLEKWQLNTEEKYKSRFNEHIGRINLTHDAGKKTIWKLDINYSQKQGREGYENIMTGDIQDSLKDKLDTRQQKLSLSFEQTISLRKNVLMQLQTRISGERGKQEIIAISDRLSGFFKTDSAYFLSNGYLKTNTNAVLNKINWLYKKKGSQWQYGLVSEWLKNSYQDSTSISTISEDSTKTMVGPRFSNVTTARLLLFAACSQDIGKKASLAIGAYTGLGIVSYSTRLSRTIYRLVLNYSYSFNPFRHFNFSLETGKSLPAMRQLYPDSLLSGNAVILNGIHDIKTQTAYSLTLSYRASHLLAAKSFFLTSSVSSVQNDFGISSNQFPSFIEFYLRPGTRSQVFFLNSGVDRYLPELKSRISIMLSVARIHQSFFLNGNKANSLQQNLAAEFKYISAFESIFNMECSYRFTFSSSNLLSQEPGNNSNKLFQHIQKNKLKITCTRKANLSLLANFYQLSAHTRFSAFDAALFYRWNKKILTSTVLHNALNHRSIVSRNTTATSVAELSTAVVARYLLVKLVLDF